MLERESELAELGAAAREAKSGAGSVVLIVGEAGIDKSSLVEAIRSVLLAEGRLLVGYCDDLATPLVLGPLRDLIGSVGTGLTEALATGDRGRVIDAFLSRAGLGGASDRARCGGRALGRRGDPGRGALSGPSGRDHASLGKQPRRAG